MISNERLEELIAEIDNIGQDIEAAREAMDFPEYLRPKLLHPEIVVALKELQRYRQAATAGVEEAIQRITLSLYGEFIETPCFDPSVPSAVASVKSLNRHRRKVYDANVSVLRETLAAELTALLAERDAMLRECREYIQDAVDEQCRGCELLARIDALTKGVERG